MNETECSKCDRNEVCKFIHEYCEVVAKAEKEMTHPVVIVRYRCRFFRSNDSAVRLSKQL